MLIQHIYSYNRKDFEKRLNKFVSSLAFDELKKIKYSTSATEEGIYFSALILYEKLNPGRYINQGE